VGTAPNRPDGHGPGLSSTAPNLASSEASQREATMNVFAEMEARVADALAAMQRAGALAADLELAGFEVEPPRDAGHGDMACNAAMVLAKRAKQKPRELAEALATRLAVTPDVERVEVAGPGFLNITMTNGFWQREVGRILQQGRAYGRAEPASGARINVEYVSANPTGPMHVGHCRGAVFGDALANLLAFAGYDVTREYYVNDAGAQVDVLARSAFLRYREALGENIGPIPEGLYPGDYLIPVGEALARTHGRRLLDEPEETWLPAVRQVAIDAMLAMIRDDLAALDVRHDVFFSERSLQSGGDDRVHAALEALRAKGVVYQGRLERPKGHDVEDWEDREQTLFRSTDFGDDVDRALLKSDGSYTYFASDIAYHYDKVLRGFAELINVFGADHSGYLKRMTAAVRAMSDGKIGLDIKVCQLVRLLRDGEPVKMSKRAGTFVTLREVVDEVGRDPVRFMMLYRKNDATLDFDLVKVLEQSKDNPVFYVQYAHARASSLLRNALEAFPQLPGAGRSGTPADLERIDLARLTDTGERDLAKRLAYWPRLVAGAARAHEPHRLAFYLYDLASALHGQWARGNETPHLRFIRADDEALTAARVALVTATAHVISSGLSVLGVQAPEEMR
jgi:arginyl-tRNA synthetase